MKQEDFNRLKAVCEKEGFDVLNLTHDDNEKYVLVKKQKDIWEGVEFALSLKGNEIFIMDELSQKMPFDCITDNFTPSTESAYIEQLKKECFKRFGDIKELDRFETASGGENEFSKFGNIEWDYFKKVDQFFHYNVELYCEGKWATRVKERVKVDGINSYGMQKIKPEWDYDFRFKISDFREDAKTMHHKVLPFLAQKLEEYLNQD